MSDETRIDQQLAEIPAPKDRFKTFAIQIAEGFAQAERGELVDADQAVRILQDRRAIRRIA
jgi:hypothetical protein